MQLQGYSIQREQFQSLKREGRYLACLYPPEKGGGATFQSLKREGRYLAGTEAVIESSAIWFQSLKREGRYLAPDGLFGIDGRLIVSIPQTGRPLFSPLYL